MRDKLNEMKDWCDLEKSRIDIQNNEFQKFHNDAARVCSHIWNCIESMNKTIDVRQKLLKWFKDTLLQVDIALDRLDALKLMELESDTPDLKVKELHKKLHGEIAESLNRDSFKFISDKLRELGEEGEEFMKNNHVLDNLKSCIKALLSKADSIRNDIHYDDMHNGYHVVVSENNEEISEVSIENFRLLCKSSLEEVDKFLSRHLKENGLKYQTDEVTLLMDKVNEELNKDHTKSQGASTPHASWNSITDYFSHKEDSQAVDNGNYYNSNTALTSSSPGIQVRHTMEHDALENDSQPLGTYYQKNSIERRHNERFLDRLEDSNTNQNQTDGFLKRLDSNPEESEDEEVKQARESSEAIEKLNSTLLANHHERQNTSSSSIVFDILCNIGKEAKVNHVDNSSTEDIIGDVNLAADSKDDAFLRKPHLSFKAEPESQLLEPSTTTTNFASKRTKRGRVDILTNVPHIANDNYSVEDKKSMQFADGSDDEVYDDDDIDEFSNQEEGKGKDSGHTEEFKSMDLIGAASYVKEPSDNAHISKTYTKNAYIKRTRESDENKQRENEIDGSSNDLDDITDTDDDQPITKKMRNSVHHPVDLT